MRRANQIFALHHVGMPMHHRPRNRMTESLRKLDRHFNGIGVRSFILSGAPSAYKITNPGSTRQREGVIVRIGGYGAGMERIIVKGCRTKARRIEARQGE